MTINFKQLGQGEPVLVIHGLFGTSDNLRQIANRLSAEHCVYLIDLPGHGSSETVVPLSLANMAQSVYEFCQQQQLSNVMVLGHSLGGKVAMEMALTFPDLISKLIVADIAPVEYARRHDQIINGLKLIDLDNTKSRQQAESQLQQYIEERGVRAFLIKSLKRDQNDNSKWRWDFDLPQLASDYDLLIKAPCEGKFAQPVLFILGGESNYVLPEHEQAIKSRFSNISFKVIQNAGHWLHAEKPVAFEKICRDFLTQ